MLYEVITILLRNTQTKQVVELNLKSIETSKVLFVHIAVVQVIISYNFV